MSSIGILSEKEDVADENRKERFFFVVFCFDLIRWGDQMLQVLFFFLSAPTTAIVGLFGGSACAFAREIIARETLINASSTPELLFALVSNTEMPIESASSFAVSNEVCLRSVRSFLFPITARITYTTIKRRKRKKKKYSF